MKRYWARRVLFLLLFMGVSLAVADVRCTDSGALWPDGPRYANGGAMIHDWLLSDQVMSPYEFAKSNYRRYPGFNLPYHPPAFPGLMGLFFLVTDVSYSGARLFIGLMLGISACAFYGVLRHFNTSRAVSFICCALMITTPEIAKWSRDTMSEIPALALMLLGSLFFLRWIRDERNWDFFLCFLFAELAFFSRLSTSGIMVGWLLFAVCTGKTHLILRRVAVIGGVLYLAIGVAWVSFVVQFAKYETTELGSAAAIDGFSTPYIWFYMSRLPNMVGLELLVMSGIGLAIGLVLGRRGQDVWRSTVFWTAWFVGYTVFQMAQAHNEQRYFLFALPSIAGVCGAAVRTKTEARVSTYLAMMAMVIVLVVNIGRLRQIPKGVVGYEQVAEFLANRGESGNILLATPIEQDVMFRYRGKGDQIKRQLIRADRTVVLRLPYYGRGVVEPPTPSKKAVLNVIRNGRVRYIVTARHGRLGGDIRHGEMVVVHRVCLSSVNEFELLAHFPLLIDFSNPISYEVYVWKYRGKLRDGASDLPVVIPTAGMRIQ